MVSQSHSRKYLPGQYSLFWLVLIILILPDKLLAAVDFRSSYYSFEEGAGCVTVHIDRYSTDPDYDELSYPENYHFRIYSSGYDGAIYREDFHPIDGDDNIHFPAGGNHATITFNINDDNEYEGNEYFTIELWYGYEGEYEWSQVEAYTDVELVDNDPEPNPGYLEAADDNVTVQETDGSVRVGFRRVGGTTGEISRSYFTYDGYSDSPATAGEDYTRKSGTLTWRDGEDGTKYVEIPITEDTRYENTEDFYVEVDDECGCGYGPVTRVSIENVNPQPGYPDFSHDGYRVKEDAGSLSINLTRIGGSDGRLRVEYSTDGKDATAGEDFEHVEGAIEWGNNDTSRKTIKIPIINDRIPEEDETIGLYFSVISDYGEPEYGGVDVVIENVTPQYGSLRFNPTSVTRKESDGEAVLTVERVSGSDGAVSVKYRTGDDGDSAEADSDYKNTRGTLNWADGDSRAKQIKVPLYTDTRKENTETFSVRLYDVAGGAAVGDRSNATVSIHDSTSFGALEFKSTSQNAAEDQGTVRIAVRRVDGSDGAVSVRYTIGADNDSATKGTDYTASNGTLNWANGDTADKQIEVALLRDAVRDDNEFITLTLSGPGGNAALGNNTSLRLNIADATNFGSFAFSAETFEVRESDDSVAIRVKRNGGTDGAVSVRVRSGAEGDSATAGADYTALDNVLSWNAGEGGEKTVALKVAEDDDLEELEFLTLTLSDATGGSNIGSPASARVEIDNTTLPKFGGITIANPAQRLFEGAGSVLFRVQRVGGSDGEVSVNYNFGADGDSAVEGEDYTLSQASGTLTWADKDAAEKTLEVALISDRVIEGEESLTLTLSNPQGGVILGDNPVATLIIQDQLPEDFTPVLDILSGNQQSGFPGNVLEPFVISVADDSEPVPGATVKWTVEPADAGRLIEGATTNADSDARAQNQLEILKGGKITVTAKVETATTNSVTQKADNGAGAAMFTVNAGFEAVSRLNPNESKVGASMDSACAALRAEEGLSAAAQDLLRTCEVLEQSTDVQIELGIERLTPEEMFAIGTSSIDTSDLQVTNVQSRINSIRLGSNGIDLNALNLKIYDQRIPGSVVNAAGEALTGGAGGDGEGSKLGVFASGSIAFGELDESEREKGFEFDTKGVTVGLDYRTDNNWVYGCALGMVSHSGDFSSEEGNLDMSGTSFTGFLTWYEEDDAYFDAIVSYGQNDFDIKRRINLPGEADQFALSKPKANELSFSIGAGLEYDSGSWQFGPYGRVSYTQSQVDAYTETASNPNAAGAGSVLSVSEQSLDSSSLVLGGQVSKTINTRRGVFIPQLRFELEHKFDDEHRDIEAHFVHDPSASKFKIESEEVDTDYYNIGTGISAVFANGKSAFLFYETRADQDRVSQHWIKGGVRFEFR